MPSNDRERPTGSWGDYYGEELSLPAVHDHLKHLGAFLAKCLAYFDGKRVLEIGTGTGVMAVYFSQLGYEVTGMDSDARIVALNRRLNRRFDGTAQFVRGDMFHLPFAEGTFDACYHQGLLEHFDRHQIVAALKAQTQICRRVIFTVPTKRWRGGLFGDERLWCGHEWRALLGGFRVLDVFGGAYRSTLTRGMNFLTGKVTSGRPRWLAQHMALAWAGEIGFVIAGR